MAPDPTTPFMTSAPQVPASTPVQGAVVIKEQLQTLAARALADGEHDVVLDTLRKLSERPGWKTTEFYLSLILGTIGGILTQLPGKEMIGAIMASVAVLAYNLSRGIAKTAGALLVALALASLSGCTANGKIEADAIADTVNIVCDRDDVYVDADPTLSPADKATKKRSTALLKKTVAEAQAAEHPTSATPK